MFRNKTVLIVGAGASFEVGFPVGTDLRNRIADYMLLKSNSWGETEAQYLPFFESILQIPSLGKSRQRIGAAFNKIAGGIRFTGSVDTFLEIHASDLDVQACAKAAICTIIADRERGSPLYVDPGNLYNVMDTSRLKDTWLQRALLSRHQSSSRSCATSRHSPSVWVNRWRGLAFQIKWSCVWCGRGPSNGSHTFSHPNIHRAIRARRDRKNSRGGPTSSDPRVFGILVRIAKYGFAEGGTRWNAV